MLLKKPGCRSTRWHHFNRDRRLVGVWSVWRWPYRSILWGEGSWSYFHEWVIRLWRIEYEQKKEKNSSAGFPKAESDCVPRWSVPQRISRCLGMWREMEKDLLAENPDLALLHRYAESLDWCDLMNLKFKDGYSGMTLMMFDWMEQSRLCFGRDWLLERIHGFTNSVHWRTCSCHLCVLWSQLWYWGPCRLLYGQGRKVRFKSLRSWYLA